MRQLFPSQRARGFSMVEMSIVLVIIALLAGSAISVSTSRVDTAKIIQTQNKLARIDKAIAAFYKLNGRLPRPANAARSLDVDDGNYNADYNNEVTMATATAAVNVVTGAVPTEDLSLPDDFMFDGWGRKFTYVVDKDLAQTAIAFSQQDGGDIVVRQLHPTTGAMDAEITPTACPTNPIDGTVTNPCRAAYAIISHGPNGSGATTRRGASPIGAGGGTPEEENADNDLTVVQDLERTGYDDITLFGFKWQVVNLAGAAFDHSVCVDAAAALRPYWYDADNGGTGDASSEGQISWNDNDNNGSLETVTAVPMNGAVAINVSTAAAATTDYYNRVFEGPFSCYGANNAESKRLCESTMREMAQAVCQLCNTCNP
jgi:prepilin-type N-terminal cleavage/methylation domain-containing protein